VIGLDDALGEHIVRESVERMLQPKNTLLGRSCRDDAIGCQGEPYHMDISSRTC